MGQYTYRLTETDHYSIDNQKCRAVYMIEHAEGKDDIEAVVSPELGMALVGFAIGAVHTMSKRVKRVTVKFRRAFILHDSQCVRIQLSPLHFFG